MLIRELLQQLKRFIFETLGVDLVGADGSIKARIVTGSGSPEGVVAAPMGSLYLNQAGGAATSVYVKESGGAAVAATGSLNGITIAAGNTVTIAGVRYTYVAALSAPAVPYEVLVGLTDSDSLDNLVAAITAGVGAGTTYGTGTVANPRVTAAAGAGDTVDVTALSTGPNGNSIQTLSALTAGGFGGDYLTGGSLYAATGWVAK